MRHRELRGPLTNGQPPDPRSSDRGPAVAAGTALAEFVGVTKHFSGSRLWGTGGPPVQAVAGVDLAIPAGRTMGVVGESGCGKSTLGRLLVGLEHPTGGQIRLRGRDMASLSRDERKATRFEVQMMFQDPYASLNPRMSVSSIIEEPLRARGGMSRGQRRARVTQLMGEVGLSPTSSTDFLMSCQVASANGWGWPAPWPPTPH